MGSCGGGRWRNGCQLSDGLRDKETTHGSRRGKTSKDQLHCKLEDGTIRVPAAEVEEFPFNEDEAPTEGHFPAGAERIPELRFNIGPSEGGGDEVYLASEEASSKPARDRAAAGSDFFFEVELLSVEVDDPELGNSNDDTPAW
jgi:hypothetical protein